MTLSLRRDRFARPPSAFELQLVPVVATMIASMAPLLPIVATEPMLPPFGLLVLLGWRLLRSDLWPAWAALPLGLWDDLFSGQPIGTAMAGWTTILLVLDVIEQRLNWRSHLTNWRIAAIAITAYLLYALVVARLIGGATSPVVVLPQLIVAVLTWPIVARGCGALDRWRFAR